MALFFLLEIDRATKKIYRSNGSTKKGIGDFLDRLSHHIRTQSTIVSALSTWSEK